MIASASSRAARLTFTATLFALPTLLAAEEASALHWELTDTHTSASLRGIHRTAGSVWASGTNGSVLRSTDDGKTWQPCTVPPDAGKLDFRAIWAWDAERSVVMSSGPGSQSRLYSTADGCESWQLVLENSDPAGFWDALVFNGSEGWILGDPVEGRFVVRHFWDSAPHPISQHWPPMPWTPDFSTPKRSISERWIPDRSPTLAALPGGEGAFAASNSAFFSFATDKAPLVWFCTGGPGGPRVFRRQQSGAWSPVNVPLAGSTAAAGAFSVYFRNRKKGVVVGGNYEKPDDVTGTAAFSTDGGQTWTHATHPPSGYRSAVAWDSTLRLWIAVGTNGSDLSADGGKTWQRFDSAKWNALALPWAAGPQGRIARLLAK